MPVLLAKQTALALNAINPPIGSLAAQIDQSVYHRAHKGCVCVCVCVEKAAVARLCWQMRTGRHKLHEKTKKKNKNRKSMNNSNNSQNTRKNKKTYGTGNCCCVAVLSQHIPHSRASSTCHWLPKLPGGGGSSSWCGAMYLAVCAHTHSTTLTLRE